MSEALYRWLDTVATSGGRLYLKRLSGNDTLLTGSHQAGPYIPRQIMFDLFPSLVDSIELNPRVTIPVVFPVESVPERDVTAIWYNNKIVEDGTRNECRITGWGGKESPLLDPEATGSVVVLCFIGDPGVDVEGCEAWVCSSVEEENLLEDRFGPIDPGTWLYMREPARQGLYGGISRPVDKDCRLTSKDLPAEWLQHFPSGEMIIEKAASLRPAYAKLASDDRLLKRRECEYEVFLSIEAAVVLPIVEVGFPSVDLFVDFANSVTNRRKSRSGRSLELHAKRIFDEEEVESYSHDQVSEGKKRPDFLFPSAEAYRNPDFPEKKLRMLAAKTTCKDRWRQVTDEATRIPTKHLLTLQEGVSETQFAQMEASGIKLVVPRGLHDKYPKSLRARLVAFDEFIREVKDLK